MKSINQEVEVNSFYFTQGTSFKSFPREITFGNCHYAFGDGLQFLVQRGQDVIRFFTMTDGQMNYRLRNENNRWILLDIRAIGR